MNKFYLLTTSFMGRNSEGTGSDYDNTSKWFKTEAEARSAFEKFAADHAEPVDSYRQGAYARADHQTAALYSYDSEEPFSESLDRDECSKENQLDSFEQPITW